MTDQPIEIDDEDDVVISEEPKNEADWTKLPSSIFTKLLKPFNERDLRKLVLVCKSWSEEIAMIINSRKNANTPEIETTPKVDLSPRNTPKPTIRVIPSALLRNEKDVIDLSSESDVIDLCETEGGGRKNQIWQTISSRRFSKPVIKQNLLIARPNLQIPTIITQPILRATLEKTTFKPPARIIPPVMQTPAPIFHQNPVASTTSQIKRPQIINTPEPQIKKPKLGFKVAVVDQNARNGFICDQVWAEFRRQMSKAVMMYIEKYPHCTDPVFFYTGMENDRRWYKCEDQFSLNFLKSTVNDISTNWSNVKLKVDSFSNIYERRKAEITINNPNLTAYEVTSLILTANTGFSRSDILISPFKKNPNEQTFILDMGSEIAELIQKRNSKINFEFQQIDVKFLVDNDSVVAL